MVIEEKISETLVKHSSDNGMYIRQVETGIEYSSAVDIVPCRYTYEETERKIEEILRKQEEENRMEESGI